MVSRKVTRWMIPAAIVCLFLTVQSEAQNAGLQGFSVKLSPGALTYYGDLSTNNYNIVKRVATGSKFGFGAGIIKQFSPFFGVQAQFTAGSLYTAAPDNTYFAGSLQEYSLSARFDPLKLSKKSNYWLSPYLSVGVATLGYRSVRREKDTNVVILPDFGYSYDGVTNTRRVTAMSMPIAAGVSMRILPYLQIEVEHAMRLTNTDLIDCYKGEGTSNDLYSLTSIGIRYTIPVKGSRSPENYVAPRKTPKARESVKKPAEQPVVLAEPVDYIEMTIPEKIIAGSTVDVKVLVKKGNLTGPARLVQKYPAGFTTPEDPGRSSLFSFINQNLIISWNPLPSDQTITFSYKIDVAEDVAGIQTISGKFEYKGAGGSAQVYSFSKSVYVEAPSQEKEKEVPIDELLKQYDKEKKADTPARLAPNIKTSEPLEGIEFRVQCGAFRDRNSADKELARKFNITETIQEELLDGWYKYTVGSFRTYAEAAKYREAFIAKTRILSAFIVAYRDGKRLANINEALK